MFRFMKNAARSQKRVRSAYRCTSSVLSFNHDGLAIARTRNERRWLPLWHIAVFLYLAMLIRIIVIADIGPASYANRVERMSNGTVLERVASVAMYMDPVSRAVAIEVRNAMRNLGML